MGDEDDAGAVGGDPPHRLEQALDLVVVQRGRRLVEDEHVVGARPAVERAGDRDDRPLGLRQRRDRDRDRERMPEAGDQLMRVAALGAPTDRPQIVPETGPPEPQVLDRRQHVDEAEVLVDDVQLVGHVDLRPGIGGVDARQDLDERRLPRPVVPDHRHDLAGIDPQRDVVQGLDPWERLAQALDAQQWTGHGGHRPSRRATAS